MSYLLERVERVITIKDLQKLIENQQQTTTQLDEELNTLKSKLVGSTPNTYKKFYVWPESVHEERYKNSKGQCCWWHIVGPAQKNGEDMPLLPYQHLLWRMLHEKRRLWIKKARGIGLSTLMLHILAYKIITEFKPGDRVIIITGIRIETVADLLRRLKLLFQRNFPGIYTELTKQKDTICVLGGVICEGFPAEHTDSVRGLDRVKAIWVDEADWFSNAESKAVRSAVEAFISKPNSENMYLVLSSTANKPNGLFETLEKEDPSIYYKLFLLYQYGLEGPKPIYDLKFIEEAKRSLPDFPREYLGQYLGLVGNIFSIQSIEKCQSVHYNPHTVIPNTRVSVGIDPSFGGSSKFGIVATRFVNQRIEVVVAEEHSRPDFASMIDRIFEIKQQMGISACYVDAANPEVWQSLKKEVFSEPYSESYISEKMQYCRKHSLDLNTYMVCIPVPFSTQGRAMLQHAKSLVEDPDGLVLIDKSFDKLLMALRTASAEDSRLSKEQTSFHDVLDGFRLSLQYYRRSK